MPGHTRLVDGLRAALCRVVGGTEVFVVVSIAGARPNAMASLAGDGTDVLRAANWARVMVIVSAISAAHQVVPLAMSTIAKMPRPWTVLGLTSTSPRPHPLNVIPSTANSAEPALGAHRAGDGRLVQPTGENLIHRRCVYATTPADSVALAPRRGT